MSLWESNNKQNKISKIYCILEVRSAREDSEAAKEIRKWDEILYQVSLKSNT